MPSGLVSIGQYAFSHTKLRFLELPEALERAGEHLFWCCKHLESIDIPRNMKILPRGLLQECSSLSSITIPSGITEISEYFISRCSNLKTININHSIERLKISENAFRTIDLNSCILYVPIELIEKYRRHPVFGLFKNILPR